MCLVEYKCPKIIIRLFLVIFFINGSFYTNCFGQWGAPYANSWIHNDQKYIKVTVVENGLHRIAISSLPPAFATADKNYLQIFHRGKEVSIVRSDDKEIVFYGLVNDGASDSLFYRPMSSRLNTYSSLYSDQGAYFLTLGTQPGKRSLKLSIDQSLSAVTQKYNLGNALSVFSTQYSLSTEFTTPNFLNSFFEKGASRTGERFPPDSLIELKFQMTDYLPSQGLAPQLSTLVHGMDNFSRTVDIYVGKTRSSVRKLGTLSLEGLVGKVFKADLNIEDFDTSGKGSIFFKSTGFNARDRFAVAFQSIVYPQAFKMDYLDRNSVELPASGDAISRIEIEGLKDESQILDVTDADNPKVLTVSGQGIIVPRVAWKKVNLFITNSILQVDSNKLLPITFQRINPSDYNYIIITNELLAESCSKYASYRSSVEGGSHKVLVVKIKDLYNQFNFGETSPVAIRRFIDFMVADGNKERHLFLVGKSINPIEKMTKELEEYVPAVGYPGSDILTLEGLGGSPSEVPVIPVGRLIATSVKDVEVYLDKVKEYEKNVTGDFGWKKRLLHLNGGHNASEISDFQQVLESLSPLAENGQLGGRVEAKVKQTNIEVESVNIAPEINEGVGMLTYFGHGSRTKTDLDFGYISDPDRGYSENFKYPLMYFNGCGVGNIFRGAYNTDATASDRRPLSMDWILTPRKGAIVIMANSSSSFVSPSLNFLKKLYEALFSNSMTVQASIGTIQREAILKVMAGPTDFYDVANIHQSVLQGDPALHLINVDKPDYSLDRAGSLILYSDKAGQTIGSSATFKTAIVVSNLGKYEKGTQLPVKIQYTFSTGGSETIKKLVSAVPYQDTIYVSFSNSNRIQKIEVVLDELNTIPELSKTNNRSELTIDWNIASKLVRYPIGSGKDIIPPTVSVKFNNRIVSNDETFNSKPLIQIVLQDDNFLQLDSSLVDVFIKNCVDESCDFVKIPFSQARFKLEYLDNYAVKFSLNTTNLVPGGYELLVNSRDLAGNKTVIPYRVRFLIGKEVQELLIICSPNPATDYLKFTSNDYDPESINSMDLIVFDSKGSLLEKRSLEVGEKDWYWFSKHPGLIVYKILVGYMSGKSREISGKVAVIK